MLLTRTKLFSLSFYGDITKLTNIRADDAGHLLDYEVYERIAEDMYCDVRKLC